MERLSLPALRKRDDLALGFERQEIQPGVVHLGTGNFHRAHQAAYLNQACGKDRRWGIVGVNLHSATMREALLPQDFLYTLLVIDGEQTKAEVVGSLLGCHHMPSDPEAVLGSLEDERTRMVTITITEKGYCLVPSTGDLDESLVKADLENPRQPVTALGVIAEGLRRKKERSLMPFAVVSCDNLAGNGSVLKKALLQYCGLVDPGLARWIDGQVAFPCSMVDRITPATTEKEKKQAVGLLGMRDESPVPTEAFSQWVIERFDGEQPPWDEIGVEVVDDVRPYEKAKLRVLNAAHFAMAFIGPFRGCKTVYECMQDEKVMGFVRRLLDDEVTPGLSGLGKDGAKSYIEATLDRFRNKGMVHLLAQIRKDGSQKIGPRVLGTLSENLAAGHPCACLERTVAAWLAFWHLHFSGKADAADDPHHGALKQVWDKADKRPDMFIMSALQDKVLFGVIEQGNDLAKKIKEHGTDLLADPDAFLEGQPGG